MTPIVIILVGLGLVGILLILRPRRFFLVRHGETLLNAAHIRQGSEGGLSERGKAQAEEVGRYLAPAHPKLIISSTFLRARETSDIINHYLHVPILTSDLLIERRSPHEIVGKPNSSEEVQRIIDQMDLAYHEDDFRISDEENFLDLKRRARKCLALLSRQGAPSTVVVTHHVFLKMLIAYMLHGEKISAADFVKLSFFNYSDNAGVSICEYSPWRRFTSSRGWRVTSYNEKVSEDT